MNVDDSSSIMVNDSKFSRISVFTYPGPAVASDGSLVAEVNTGVSAVSKKPGLYVTRELEG